MTPIHHRLFEIIDGELFAYKKAIQAAGLSVSYFGNLSAKGSEKTMLHPTNKKVILVRYAMLGDKHKEALCSTFGNPYEYVVKEPIRQLIKKNQANYNALLQYKYAGGKSLPMQRVKQYSRACDILEALVAVDESRNGIIKDLGINVPTFYEHLKSIINEEKLKGEIEGYDGNDQLYPIFPASYDKLRLKIAEYKEKGYACVIDKRYGNDSALKVKEDDSKDFLIGLFKNPTQYNDVLVCMIYNTEAQNRGWKTITPATVQNWRKEYGYEITTEREGVAAYNEKFIRQVKGMRPSAPLFLVEHDDNNLDLLFQDKEGGQFNRYVAIVVTDSHCDLVLGKSVIQGHIPETVQVQLAYIDAMYYIRSLTGAWYMPHELKADKWRSQSLTPFYNKIAKHVPPSHGNKHRGYIEQFFGSSLWKNSMKLVSQGNYNGNNMTAKFRGFNPDMLDVSLKDKSRPMIGSEAELQIEQFFYLLRNMPDFKRSEMNAPSKQEKWLKAWNELPAEQKIQITDEQFLLTFGFTHKPKHTDTIRITNRGVEPQISNTKYSYDLPETWMYNKLQGAAVQVIYDPYDMSRVLITNQEDIRFIARSATLAPRALKDQHTGSRAFLNSILEAKKDQVQMVAQQSGKRKQFKGAHAASLLQSGAVLPKEIRNDAEQKQIEQFDEDYNNSLDERADLDKFFS